MVAVFGRIPDPRKPRGRRHSLAVVLTLATCAVLAGARSFTAIGEWGTDAGPSCSPTFARSVRPAGTPRRPMFAQIGRRKD
ncbi:transposase family protein [Parafrankia sp. FMc6]